MKKIIKIASTNKGFTLVEILFTTVILAIVVGSLIELFMYCSFLAEASRDLTIAMHEAQNKLEEIRNDNYDNIVTDYANKVYDITSPNGKIYTYVDNTNTDLLIIKVAVCWQNSNGRVMGEDQNVDGTLTVSEDKNGNSQADSEATLLDYIARR